MVTKQDQLEWLAARFESLPFHSDIILMSDEALGYVGCEHKITNKELKQERDKMQQKCNESECGVMTLGEAIDHANEKSRELEGVCAENHRLLAHWLTKYRDTLSKGNHPESDNSWHERGELPPVGCECEVVQKSGGAWIKAVILAVTNQNVIMLVNGEPLEVVYRASNVIFRPLRTEREKAIDELAGIITNSVGYSNSITEAVAKQGAAALYDAGCRITKQ